MTAIGILLLFVGLSWLAYIYRDKLAGWFPGLKHGLTGWPTAIGGTLLALLQFLQGQEATITVLFVKHPEITPLVMTGLGFAILVLSWITPRQES